VSASLNAQLQQQLSAVVQWPMPRWPVYVYFAGACVCLLTSSVCHLLGCCQRHVSQIVWRFDYAGIAVLIVASFYPAVYYAFLCQPFWRNFYLISTTLAGAPAARGAKLLRALSASYCAVACAALRCPSHLRPLPPRAGISVICVALPDRFQTVEYRVLRACVFSALGMWGVVPVAHQLIWYWDVWAIRSAFKLDILMGVLYLVRAAQGRGRRARPPPPTLLVTARSAPQPLTPRPPPPTRPTPRWAP
jgi:adiponectin receptor